METPGFKAKANGFWITFQNRWTISVQFGPGNYCENHDHSFDDYDKSLESINAECAVIDPSGELIYKSDWGEDNVKGWLSPKEVLDLIIWTESQK